MSPSSILREVVMLGGLALEAEDCILRAAVHSRGEHGGLVRVLNERYFQFVVWRAVLPKWPAKVEIERRDLTIWIDDQKHLFEMKTWLSESGVQEIRGMKKDVEKLSATEHGYFIVFSANPPTRLDEMQKDKLGFLEQHLSIRGEGRELYRFPTFDTDGTPLEFWIAGWLFGSRA